LQFIFFRKGVRKAGCGRRFLTFWETGSIGYKRAKGLAAKKRKRRKTENLLHRNIPDPLISEKTHHHEGHEEREEKKRDGRCQNFVLFVLFVVKIAAGRTESVHRSLSESLLSAKILPRIARMTQM
jgi:hypothetical protein